jgi:hypothetical protein
VNGHGRPWFWLGIAADAVLLTFGFYMAISAAMIVDESGGGVYPVAVAVLFFALPVLCILSTLSAWRAMQRRRRPGQIAVLLVAPWIYAGFLVFFLIYS